VGGVLTAIATIITAVVALVGLLPDREKDQASPDPTGRTSAPPATRSGGGTGAPAQVRWGPGGHRPPAPGRGLARRP
jgi:hypothetical protein